MGKTVIVSDTSTIRDYIATSGTAIVVQPGDILQMREQMAGLPDTRAKSAGPLKRQAACEVREKYRRSQRRGNLKSYSRRW